MHPLYTQFQHSLLGRLKTIELSSISGSLEKFPSQRALISSIMDRWRENPDYGRFLFHLIYGYEAQLVEVPAKMSVRHMDLVLRTLGRHKPITRIFAEERPKSTNKPYGVLILGHKRYDDQPGYYAMANQELGYPKCSFVSIAPNNSSNDRIQIMSQKGWQKLSLKQASKLFEVRLVISSLWNYLTSKSPRFIEISDLVADPSINPPDNFSQSDQTPFDEEFMRRITLAIKGDLSVSVVRASANQIRPFSFDHCFELEPNVIEQFLPYIDTEFPLLLVVYWDGVNFVMSDDYYTYAAYKKLGVKEMRLAVLGDFPDSHILIEKKGGIELLPPLIILPRSNVSRTPEYNSWLLDQQLHKKARREAPAYLVATWLVLADMLKHKKTTERHLHNFLRDHPITISAYATRVESEVWLGTQFRIDLLIRSSGVREEVTMIELEHHRHTIFTTDGRPTYKVTHACQQVRDWIQWLGENSDNLLAKSLGGIKPKGLVVMGRSNNFDDKERRLLVNYNESNLVRLITYDEVLDRFRDLILSQCDTEN